MTPQARAREKTVTVTLTEDQARWVASYALRNNDWSLLDVIEEAMKPLGLRKPMDVYSELADLKAKQR